MRPALRKVWGLFAPGEKRRASAILLLVALMAFAEALGVLSIIPFLSVVSSPEMIQENLWLQRMYESFSMSSPEQYILTLGLISMAAVILSSAFKTATLHQVNRFVHLQRHALSLRLLSVYLRQPYDFFLDRNPSTLAKNVLSEVDQLTFEMLQPLSQMIAHGAVVLAMLVLVFAFDPIMALLIIAAICVLYGTIYLLVRKYLAQIGRNRQIANTGRYQHCNEMLGGIKDVKVTDSVDAYLDRFQRASRQFSRYSANAETLSQSPLYLVEAAGYSGLIIIALVLLAQRNDIGEVLPAIGLYGFAAYRLLPAAQIMYRGFARLRFSRAVLESIHSDLSLPQGHDAPLATTLIRPKSEIRLHGICYAYPTAPMSPVLKDFDLAIPANSTIGITGPSGSGKSTLMDLILGLLEPQAGYISVDQIRIGSNDLAGWRRSIGYVPQHIYLTDSTIAENIAFGIPREKIDMRAVERAARTAQIHYFIANDLPQGYETRVGDRGVRLSGGQRQRVGIARALYRDPAVLLFDEATSALDDATEAAVSDAIKSLSGDKTIVLIAHRAATLDTCDRVYVLKRQHDTA